MWWWQSVASAGAFRFGAAVPPDHLTAWAAAGPARPASSPAATAPDTVFSSSRRFRRAGSMRLSDLREHEDGARDLAGLHGAKRLVDVLELPAPGDHLVQLEPALPVQLDVVRHVDLEAVGTHAATLDLLLAQEHRPVQLDLLPDRDHADHGGGAAGPDAVEALLGRDLEADALEGVVHPAAGQVPDGLHRIPGLGVDPVGRAQLLGGGELGVDGVHRDDHARPRDARALHR